MNTLTGHPVAALLAGLAALLPAPGAQAAAEASTEHVQVGLVAEAATVAPGDRLTVAFRQAIVPGWHTYWLNPGDSGEPVQLTWTLPEGVEAGPIQWPAPAAIPVGPFVNFGYSGEVDFLVDIALPAGWPVGRPLELAVDAYWLVCEEYCIPESARLGLSVPTARETRLAPGRRALFARARAAQPRPLGSVGELSATEEALLLTIPLAELGLRGVRSARFFPETWGRIDHAAPQELLLLDDLLGLRLRPGEAPADGALAGILRVESAAGEADTRAFSLRARPAGRPPAETPARPERASPGLALVLLAALAGGLVLNLMPCVFPVLALKAFGLVQHAHEPRRRQLAGGLAYTGGVLLSFLAMGGALQLAKAGGAAVGWGFHLQQPVLVVLLAYVMFLVGLNLSGVFSIGERLAGLDLAAARRGDWVGAAFTGVLAAVVAAPCTAPFMATAVGVALTRPPLPGLAVFAALGFGLALPYLLLTAFPGLARRLPASGAWMVRLKELLAFPMYGAAAWLLWVLTRQVGPDAVLVLGAGFVLLAAGARAWELARDARRPARLRSASALALVLAAGLAAVPRTEQPTPVAGAESYSAERLARLRDQGRTVFVNFTADWCITCKVNERVALSGERFRKLLAAGDVVYMKGDWTRRDPDITRALESFGRAGVPLYVIYRPGRSPELLPQVLTPGIVASHLASSRARASGA